MFVKFNNKAAALGRKDGELADVQESAAAVYLERGWCEKVDDPSQPKKKAKKKAATKKK